MKTGRVNPEGRKKGVNACEAFLCCWRSHHRFLWLRKRLCGRLWSGGQWQGDSGNSPGNPSLGMAAATLRKPEPLMAGVDARFAAPCSSTVQRVETEP